MSICKTCNGTGECRNCGGSGNLRCDYCNGTGVVFEVCGVCNGGGVLPDGTQCATCGGTGQVEKACFRCNGAGELQCDQCHGSGSCKDCGGTGQISNATRAAENVLNVTVMNTLVGANTFAAILPANVATTFDALAAIQERANARFGFFYSAEGIAFEQVYDNLIFGAADSSDQPPLRVDSREFVNNTGVTDNTQWSYQQSVTRTGTISLTNAVRTGLAVTLKVPIPKIADLSGTYSFDVSTSTTDSHSTSETETTNNTVTINVPPQSRVVATIVLLRKLTAFPFQATIRLSGSAVPRQFAVGPVFINPPFETGIGRLFSDAPHPLVRVIDDRTVESDVSGLFSAIEGLSLKVTVDQFSLPGT